MHSFIPGELTARMAELFPCSSGSYPAVLPPSFKPHPQEDLATCEKSAPSSQESSPPNSEQPQPTGQVAAAGSPPHPLAAWGPPSRRGGGQRNNGRGGGLRKGEAGANGASRGAARGELPEQEQK